MIAKAFLENLERCGFLLEAEGVGLFVSPASVLTSEERGLIRADKLQVLDALFMRECDQGNGTDPARARHVGNSGFWHPSAANRRSNRTGSEKCDLDSLGRWKATFFSPCGGPMTSDRRAADQAEVRSTKSVRGYLSGSSIFKSMPLSINCLVAFPTDSISGGVASSTGYRRLMLKILVPGM
jgi:hypothetical protein